MASQLHSSSMTSKRNEIDPIDLETEFFDNNAYVSKILKESSLVDLIRRDNDLINEMKYLDSDMKTLVYENYSKFICATDTINTMKITVDDMEKAVDQLTHQMDTILSRSNKIQDELGSKGKEIQDLGDAHNILRKLNFILELPKKLDSCLKQGQFEQAVYFYSKTAKVLTHYGHMSMFKGIVQDSQTTMSKVISKLREQLNKNNLSLKQIVHTSGLLVGADQGRGLVYAKLLFEKATPHLNKNYEQFKAKSYDQVVSLTPIMTSSLSLPIFPVSEDNSINYSIVKYIENVVSHVLNALSSFSEAYATYFLNNSDVSNNTNVSPGSIKSPSHSVHHVALSYSANLKSEERTIVLKDLQKLLGTMIPLALELIEKVLFDQWGKAEKPDFTPFTEAFNVLYVHASHSVAMNSFGGYQNKIASLARNFYEKTVSGMFTKIINEVRIRVNSISHADSMKQEEAELCTWLSKTLGEELEVSLMTLDASPTHYESNLKTSLQLKTSSLLSEFGFFWDSLADYMERYADRKTFRDPQQLRLVLFLSKFADSTSEKVIPIIGDMYGEKFVKLDGSGRKLLSRSVATFDSFNGIVNGFNVKTLVARYQTLSLGLLNHFCLGSALLHTNAINSHFQTLFTMNHAFNNQVSFQFMTFISDLNRIEQEAKVLYHSPDKKRTRSEALYSSPGAQTSLPGSASTPKPVNTYRGNAFDGMFDKLFEEKPVYLGFIDKNTISIVELVIKLVLKSCFEELRFGGLLNGVAVQQLNMDLAYWKQHIPKYVDDER